MIKLLLCLASAALIGACILQLRQQRLQMNYQTAELHEQIKSHQGRLWNQQLRIATFTGPTAITHTVDTHNLKMVPQSPLPNDKARWIDAEVNAE